MVIAAEETTPHRNVQTEQDSSAAGRQRWEVRKKLGVLFLVRATSSARPCLHRTSSYPSGVISRGTCQSMGSATRSNIDGSSFSGLFTRVEIGHMVIGFDG